MAGRRQSATVLVASVGLANVAALTAIGIAGITTGFIPLGDVNAARASSRVPSVASTMSTATVAATTETTTTPSPSPVRIPVPIDPQAIVIRLSDLRTGYRPSLQTQHPTCSSCRVASSLRVEFWNSDSQRLIISEVNVAATVDDAIANLRAILSGYPPGVTVQGLGDQSYGGTGPLPMSEGFFVIWRSGMLTQWLTISAPPGTLSLQNAIDLARVQEARAQVAIAAS